MEHIFMCVEMLVSQLWFDDGLTVLEYMAPDVHEALIGIAMEHGQLDNDAAKKFVLDLEDKKRYQKDVWF